MLGDIFKLEDFKDIFFYDQYAEKQIATINDVEITAQLLLENKTYIPFDNKKSVCVGTLSFYKAVPYYNEYFKRTESFFEEYKDLKHSIKVSSTTPLNEVWKEAIKEANRYINQVAVEKLRKLEI